MAVNLLEIVPGVLYLPGSQNIGVIPTERGGGALIIDTGLSEDTARRLLRALDLARLRPAAILNTHAHADHFGGNAWLVQRAGVPVYAPLYEEAFMRYPRLEAVGLFAGAAPIAALQGHFLLAQPSPVDHLVRPGPLTVEGVEIEAVPLGGHSANQTGYLVRGVLFSADLLMPLAVLDKYGIVYCHDVAAHLESLDRVRAIPAAWHLPAHNPPVDDLDPLVSANVGRFTHTLERIQEVLAAGPQEASALLAALSAHYSITLTSPEAYFLLQPTIYAHLSCLAARGAVRLDIEDNRALWRLAGA
jgi:glyoxylase-like metal-dependent hydrolase (beta-lactamase superfamily II)